MRKLICPTLFSFLLLCYYDSNAQLYTVNLDLTTQAQADAFNYTSVTGNLTLFSPSISNLNGLSELQSVGGKFEISTTAITNVDALTNLQSIGSLLIRGNSLFCASSLAASAEMSAQKFERKRRMRRGGREGSHTTPQVGLRSGKGAATGEVSDAVSIPVCRDHGRDLRRLRPDGRVVGLTSWSDLVQVRGLLEQRGSRLHAQARCGRLFYWEMAAPAHGASLVRLP